VNPIKKRNQSIINNGSTITLSYSRESRSPIQEFIKREEINKLQQALSAVTED